ncbi:MAG TPA: hypothetical protein EYN66_14160 [Myxococcales bacterium]|nr:hypothetical protein [Myxococcales bacterium]
MKVQVDNELSKLRSIIIHRPGPELDLMTPDNIEAYAEQADGSIIPNPHYLLFDDLVLLSRLRAEHDQIVQVLRATCGHNGTVELRDLLRTLLYEDDAREFLIDESIRLEKSLWGRTVSSADREFMMNHDPHSLLKTLTRGTDSQGRRILRWPLPNMIFTRDLAAIVGNNVLLTYGAKPARKREMLLSRALFSFHPELRDHPRLDIGPMVKTPAIEGGDIMLLGNDCVAIGVGQRTNRESAEAAAKLLLAHGMQRIYLVEIMAARATMHLDTIFTLVDHNRCLVFSPLLLEVDAMGITSVDSHGATQRRGHFLDVLAEDGMPLTPILCGGHDPIHQVREQWSDGANAFALAPGKILLYARNEQTLEQLNKGWD